MNVFEVEEKKITVELVDYVILQWC